MEELRRTRLAFTENENLVSLYALKEGYDLWEETGEETRLRKVVLPMEAH